MWKPDRDRDAEFVEGPETRQELMRAWEEGWEIVASALAGLGPENLGSTVTIATEPHTAIGAISRHLAHAGVPRLASTWPQSKASRAAPGGRRS